MSGKNICVNALAPALIDTPLNAHYAQDGGLADVWGKELLVRRWGNKEIGHHLHISPRTVEKHVASLIAKMDQPDRGALIRSSGEAAIAGARHRESGSDARVSA